MTELSELYQEVILDHSKHPRNRGKLEGAHHAEGFNPLCGDRVTIYLKTNGDRVTDLSFEGSGCAISTASVSLLTELIKGKTVTEAQKTFQNFHYLLTGEGPHDEGKDMGKLEVFNGVKEFPMRVKCATLAWHTFMAALQDKQEAISTE